VNQKRLLGNSQKICHPERQALPRRIFQLRKDNAAAWNAENLRFVQDDNGLKSRRDSRGIIIDYHINYY
jgi:hypothetical protein